MVDTTNLTCHCEEPLVEYPQSGVSRPGDEAISTTIRRLLRREDHPSRNDSKQEAQCMK